MLRVLVGQSAELADEARNFQKCLIRMFEARGAALVFESSEGGGALVVGDAPGNAPLNGRRDYEWRMRDGGLRSI